MSAERDFVCAARPSSYSQPTVQIAQLDEGAADERRGPVHLLRNPVRLAHDRELVVDPLDVARRAAGEMHEDLEQQREGQWLRVIDRARVGDRSLHQGQARVRETAQRGCSRQLAAAEEAGLDAGLPDPGAVERRIVHGQRGLEVLVRGFERAQVKERGPHRPFTNHLQMWIAEALEERQHLLRDVMGDADLARHHVVRRHADEDGDHARRVLDLPAELGLARRLDLRHGVSLARLDRERVVICSPSSAVARAGLFGSFASRLSPRCARRADSSCA